MKIKKPSFGFKLATVLIILFIGLFIYVVKHPTVSICDHPTKDNTEYCAQKAQNDRDAERAQYLQDSNH